MVTPVVTSFPKSGSDYTVTYTGRPLDKKRETRESIVHPLAEIAVSEEPADGKYLLSEEPGNGRNLTWAYIWAESENQTP